MKQNMWKKYFFPKCVKNVGTLEVCSIMPTRHTHTHRKKMKSEYVNNHLNK